MSDVAPLTLSAMRIVVNDCRPPSTGNRHRRKNRSTGSEKRGNVAVELAQLEKSNIEKLTNCGGIDWVGRTEIQFLTNS